MVKFVGMVGKLLSVGMFVVCGDGVLYMIFMIGMIGFDGIVMVLIVVDVVGVVGNVDLGMVVLLGVFVDGI